MSSPIAKLNKSLIDKIIINFHQKASHSNRINLLSEIIGKVIVKQFGKSAQIKCLDVGCGDMTIAETIHEKYNQTKWNCIDIHPLPEQLQDTEKWRKYRSFDGQHIPFGDGEFDVVLFCDVLHHTPDKTIDLLKEASRVGKIVIIKDHFQYGFFSKNMLRLMDFIGNWSYGIEIPENYFSEKTFEKTYKVCGLKKVEIVKGINLYKSNLLFSVLLNPQWQFVAILQSL